MPQLFVYGTLRTPRGGPPVDTHFHERIADAIVTSRSATLPGAELFDFGAYPGVGRGEGVVMGDLLEVSDEGLATTDLIEGHPGFYERTLEPVDVEGVTVEAWVYWAPPAMVIGRPSIASGDWFERDRLDTATVPLALPDDAGLRSAFDRIAEETYSWFTSVRADGRPHTVPMWHVVSGNRIYVATPPEAVKVANVAVNPAVVLALADPTDVVRVDGWAIESINALPEVSPHFFTKYGWNPGIEPEGSYTVVEV
ncbi:MAG: hypothetical protein HKO87_01950, partial [Acidimicrobiia bacterium]|nr:hypothetical protein [Acidimicrobiia bacterium]